MKKESNGCESTIAVVLRAVIVSRVLEAYLEEIS